VKTQAGFGAEPGDEKFSKRFRFIETFVSRRVFFLRTEERSLKLPCRPRCPTLSGSYVFKQPYNGIAL
jgi:hypothetical protein